MHRLFRICADRLVAYHIHEIVDAEGLFGSLVKTCPEVLLEFLGHPDDPGGAALSAYELLGSYEVTAMSHESGCLYSAAGHGGQLTEGHSCGCHAGVLAVDDHDAV